MKYRAFISWRTPDGREGEWIEPRGKRQSIWEEEGGVCWFLWSDGNYSCDCNRSLFFLDEEWDCGESIKITQAYAFAVDEKGVVFVRDEYSETEKKENK